MPLNGVLYPRVRQEGVSLFRELGFKFPGEARRIESPLTFQPFGLDAGIHQNRAGTPDEQIWVVLAKATSEVVVQNP